VRFLIRNSIEEELAGERGYEDVGDHGDDYVKVQ
jgi:hypothetical protein